jgi:hypothetical protein
MTEQRLAPSELLEKAGDGGFRRCLTRQQISRSGVLARSVGASAVKPRHRHAAHPAATVTLGCESPLGDFVTYTRQL